MPVHVVSEEQSWGFSTLEPGVSRFLLCSLDVRETLSVHIQCSAGDVLGWWPSLVKVHTESASPKSSLCAFCPLSLMDTGQIIFLQVQF